MSPEFEQSYPQVARLIEYAYGDVIRKDGTPYSSHAEWVGDTAATILSELKLEYSDYINDDFIEAVRINGYLHDAGEIKPDITSEVVTEAAKHNMYAQQIGYCFMLMTHNKSESSYLQYTKNVVPFSAQTVFEKSLDIVNNVFIRPKPKPYKDSYVNHLQEYLTTLDFYLEIACTYPDAPWLEPALDRVIDVAIHQASNQLNPDLQDWLYERVAA